MQNITQIITDLLAEDTSLEAKIEYVTVLNQYVCSPSVLDTLAAELRKHEVRVQGVPEDAVDMVGTGGDGFNTLNFSTLGCLRAQRAGVTIVKHGNRAVTSKCGSFDLIEQMRLPIAHTPQDVLDHLAQQGCAFLFAPSFHPIFKRVMDVRAHFKAQGLPTIFNVLGPLLFPAGVTRMVTGVAKPELIEPYAKALVALGIVSGYVFYGDGLDELTLTGPTTYAKIDQGEISLGTLTPDDLGLAACKLEDILGGAPEENMAQGQAVLAGKLPGPKTDMVVAGAAAAIRVSQDFKVSWNDAVRMAREKL
jgi:anthranilate phosphoribosyltransferase